jgi:hypothetical protein
MTGLPGILADIAEVAGLQAALALADQYGGTQVDIPRHAHDQHWLVRCVGREAADRICAHMTIMDADGRTRGARGVLIPRGPMALMRKARRRLADEIRAGRSVRDASRIAGLSERTGWYVKAEIDGQRRRDPDQGDLF